MIDVLNWFAVHPILGVILLVLAGSFLVAIAQGIGSRRVYRVELVVTRKD